jgi:hypothetical protein
MKRVELYGRVRHAVMIDGLSQREAARHFGIDPRTVKKMMSYSVPPGYVRTKPPVRPKLDGFTGIIDRILEEDKLRPKKQRHTSKRIFERLREGQHEGGALAPPGADGAEQVGVGVSLIGGQAGAGSLLRPDPGATVLLAQPGFILEPDLDPLALGQTGYVGRERAREVFLNASITC